MSDAYPVANLEFGEIKMSEYIADISDLALLLKANEEYIKGGILTPSLPEGSDLPLNTIIQLTEAVPGTDGNGTAFIAGHFYQYSNATGTPNWYDVTDGVTRIKRTGYGCYYTIDSQHVKCVWSDPVSDADDNEWVKSELYLVYVDTNGMTQYELMYTELDFNDCSKKDGVVVDVGDGIDTSKCKFVVRYYFEDTTTYSSITLPTVTSIAGSRAFSAFQSDWGENDPNNASFIKNRPVLIRRIWCEGNDVYVDSDDPSIRDRISIDEHGNIWLDNLTSVKIGRVHNYPDTDGSELQPVATINPGTTVWNEETIIAKLNELATANNTLIGVVTALLNAGKPVTEP